MCDNMFSDRPSRSNKGMVWSDMSKPALISFFTAKVHTTKSTLKILAANMHCKYFLKIAEVTHFICTWNRLYQRFVQPFLAFTTAVTRQGELDLGNKDEQSCVTLLKNLICYNGHNAHTYIICNTSFTSSTCYPQWSNSLFNLYSRHKNAKSVSSSLIQSHMKHYIL
jgi:hypothetical protein